ncbi:MAG: hypothetical protein NW224_27580 [Leptolyngbyaceae cyanobacterium bins.302]|nr:hypothetical protein [Leptolyngbyaceae cyanobacterium bins.302]
MSLTELHALQRLSLLGEDRKLRNDYSFRKELLQPQRFERVGHYASPIAPLRDRDRDALVKLFHRTDMYDIEVDVNQMLLQLLPEPCWDEDGFDFLREFL